jgi:NADP-dependent 3-hydroxy acid dehydrogenase YdfG
MRPVALVTGASRGLGAAIARELATTHRILVGGTNPITVDEMVAELGDAEPFLADLRDDDSLARLAAGVDRLDVLVHNAGIEMAKTLEESTRQDFREIFEVNVFAVAELTRLLLPQLRESHGHVLTINSGMGFRSTARGALYSGAKFALRAFTDALREEERGRVRVTSIHPGRVDTDMQRAMMARDEREYEAELYIRPESVAATVRLAIDTTPEANIDELQIRPVTIT